MTRTILNTYFLAHISLTVFFCMMPFEAFADVFFLENGDRISGQHVHTNNEYYVVKTEALGVINIAKPAVREVLEQAPLESPAPEAAEKREREEEEKEQLWTRKITAGFDRRRGNTETTEMLAGLLIHRKLDREDKKNEFHLRGDAYYSSANREMNSRKYYGMTRYAFSFGPELMWYNFYKFEAEHDRFSNIDARLTPSTGVGYWFSDAEDFKFMLEAGPGIQYTNFRKPDDSETELIAISRAFIEKKIFERTKISEEVTVYPSLSDMGEYRLRSETVLESALNEQFSLRFTLLDEYNSEPKGEAEKNDIRLTSSLAYSF